MSNVDTLNINSDDLQWKNLKIDKNDNSLDNDEISYASLLEYDRPIYIVPKEDIKMNSIEQSRILKFCSLQGTCLTLSQSVGEFKSAIFVTELFYLSAKNPEFARLVEAANKNYYKLRVDIGKGKEVEVDMSEIDFE